jgi:hypothetical protein
MVPSVNNDAALGWAAAARNGPPVRAHRARAKLRGMSVELAMTTRSMLRDLVQLTDGSWAGCA